MYEKIRSHRQFLDQVSEAKGTIKDWNKFTSIDKSEVTKLYNLLNDAQELSTQIINNIKTTEQ